MSGRARGSTRRAGLWAPGEGVKIGAMNDTIKPLPVPACPEREFAIIDAIKAGLFAPVQWSAIRCTAGQHSGILYVATDALMVRCKIDRKVDDGWVIETPYLGSTPDDATELDELLRVTVCHDSAQRIADIMGAMLPTKLISDLAFKNATVKITPCLQPPDAGMANTSRMLRHHREVEAKRNGAGGLISTVGKDWINTNKLEGRPDRAANYGWHRSDGTVWQGVGLAHNRFHVDYSQVVRLVCSTMLVDGVPMAVADVAKSRELAAMISDEGVLRVVRHPGVPVNQRVDLASVPPPLDPDVESQAAPDPVIVPRLIVDVLPTDEPPVFVQARHFTPHRQCPIDLVVIHTMEAIEKPTTATAVATWFAGPSAPMASAHYCIDNLHVVQCVRDDDVAWHAPGVNHNAIGIEHAGYAKQSAAEWNDPFSAAMLELSAKLIAGLCMSYGLPIEFVDRVGLLAGKRGITTHAEVTAAFHKSDHTDPGAHFPMASFIELVRSYATAL
jgi:hypothetical protein